MRKQQLLPLTESAILVAFAMVLELINKFVPLIEMPQGGSVWISMLPIMIIGIRRGLAYGLAGGITFAFFNFLIDGYAFYWGTFLFDYLLAFGVLGITGLFKKYVKNPILFGTAFFLAGFLRYLISSLSGVLFYGEYATEAGFSSVWFYSFIAYNLPSVGLSAIVSVFLAYAIRPVILQKYIK